MPCVLFSDPCGHRKRQPKRFFVFFQDIQIENRGIEDIPSFRVVHIKVGGSGTLCLIFFFLWSLFRFGRFEFFQLSCSIADIIWIECKQARSIRSQELFVQCSGGIIINFTECCGAGCGESIYSARY